MSTCSNKKLKLEKEIQCSLTQRQLCDNQNCRTCYERSLASCSRIKDFWSSENPINPRYILKGKHNSYLFTCLKCSHTFSMKAYNFAYGNQSCPYCSNKKRCQKEECRLCCQHSFESHDKSKYLDSAKNKFIKPRDIARCSNKSYYFICPTCNHSFSQSINNIAVGKWCSYCAKLRRCVDEQCEFCKANTFASSDKAVHWDYKKNGQIVPRDVSKCSKYPCWFICPKCQHSFLSSPGDITSGGRWCPYCSNHKRCNNNCKMCSDNSFESHEKSKFWNYTLNTVSPRTVAKSTKSSFWFTCPDCKHDFQMIISNIYFGQWCNYCNKYNNIHCGDSSCTKCGTQCNVCLFKKAKFKTKLSELNVCKPCLLDCLKRNPVDVDLSRRAKISMEIYCLAELQNVILEQNYPILLEPTSWDCQILPGLNFKPDLLWTFDKDGNVFETAGACKLDFHQDGIHYALQLEIIEESRVSHSAARSIDDTTREMQIRHLFETQQIPLGIVYFTVAHEHHIHAHPNDIYFVKNKSTNEYDILPEKLSVWKSYITMLFQTLKHMLETKSNTTVYLGH